MKKLSQSTISNNNHEKFNKVGSLTIDEEIIKQIYKNDTQYRIVVFEGTMILNESNEFQEISFSHGGIGVHTIKTFSNKKDAITDCPKLIREAIHKAMHHYTNLISYRYPNISPVDQDKMIPTFSITAMIMARLEDKNIVQGFITTNNLHGIITLYQTVATTNIIKEKEYEKQPNKLSQ